STLEKIQNNTNELLFLIGQDNLNFTKKNEFIVYIGTHGDKGAEISDLILPGSAYTEKEAHYTNLEGKLQKTYKASYPPGDALEDWEIINKLSELVKRKKLFKDKNELVDSMLNYLKLKKEKVFNSLIKQKNEFVNEKISVRDIDYYYSNVIARASKTMSECRNSLIKLKKTGTEG
ncbi:molybdopterin-dependent oxidoreductase, partial [Candidatus Pelagibacter sp.]|nr:molybdopterin-dependent oxidoreductase [Candidatus Pelagibacter sp.]